MIIKFDSVELVVSRIVRAIDKTIAEDIPQERREKDLETKNYIAHIRGDYLNSNLHRIGASSDTAFFENHRSTICF